MSVSVPLRLRLRLRPTFQPIALCHSRHRRMRASLGIRAQREKELTLAHQQLAELTTTSRGRIAELEQQLRDSIADFHRLNEESKSVSGTMAQHIEVCLRVCVRACAYVCVRVRVMYLVFDYVC
jgi:hypothetical protein